MQILKGGGNTPPPPTAEEQLITSIDQLQNYVNGIATNFNLSLRSLVEALSEEQQIKYRQRIIFNRTLTFLKQQEMNRQQGNLGGYKYFAKELALLYKAADEDGHKQFYEQAAVEYKLWLTALEEKEKKEGKDEASSSNGKTDSSEPNQPGYSDR